MYLRKNNGTTLNAPVRKNDVIRLLGNGWRDKFYHSIIFIRLDENRIVEPAVPAGYFVIKTLVKQPNLSGDHEAQWLEHATGITEVVGSIPSFLGL